MLLRLNNILGTIGLDMAQVLNKFYFEFFFMVSDMILYGDGRGCEFLISRAF